MIDIPLLNMALWALALECTTAVGVAAGVIALAWLTRRRRRLRRRPYPAIIQPERRPARPAAPHVVVVGAGFAGLAAVRALARAGTQVTLIDRNAYATFQPLLYQVATGGLAGSDVAYPLRAAARRYRVIFRHGELAGIDPAARQITMADGASLGYDYLIVATGVAAAYHGVPGAAEHSLSLYTRHGAIALRDAIMAELDRISRTGLRNDLTVTVIGGGATGVELAGSLADLRTTALPAYFPEISPARVHVTLVQHGPALLSPFHPVLRDYTRRQLAKRNVEVQLSTAIAEIIPGKVLLADGTALPSDITVWAAGVAAPDAVSGWHLPQTAGGRIRTGPDLRVIGQDRIFAVGDIALTGGQPLPQLAQPALQMGRHAAAQIRRLETGQPTVPFRYRDKGTMATIGYRSAIVQLPHHLRARGTAAWLAWLAPDHRAADTHVAQAAAAAGSPADAKEKATATFRPDPWLAGDDTDCDYYYVPSGNIWCPDDDPRQPLPGKEPGSRSASTAMATAARR